MTFRILVVDDSKLARMAVTKALNALYPECERMDATNADEALALARQTPFDVALLDFNMPGKSGLDLAADLRALNPKLALAVVSANHQDEILRRARELGAAFLMKPLTTQALAHFLSDALAHSGTPGR
ncbi:MAG TPA: response regulator [Micropepsaceae bacterium]|jgi:DNA-binding NarL/FixJ family response regulator